MPAASAMSHGAACGTLAHEEFSVGYSANSLHPPAQKVKGMGHIDRLDHDTEAAVRRFLVLIAERYDVAGTIIFGSRARGTHRPDSDVDVAVLLDGEHQRFLSTKLAMADAAFDVLLETGIAISPLPVWLDEWVYPENYSNPALLRNIANDGFRL